MYESSVCFVKSDSHLWRTPTIWLACLFSTFTRIIFKTIFNYVFRDMCLRYIFFFLVWIIEYSRVWQDIPAEICNKEHFLASNGLKQNYNDCIQLIELLTAHHSIIYSIFYCDFSSSPSFFFEVKVMNTN